MSCMLSNWTIRPPSCLAMFLYVASPARFGRSISVVAARQEVALPGEVANRYYAHGQTNRSCGSCEKCEDIDHCTTRSWSSLRISRRATVERSDPSAIFDYRFSDRRRVIRGSIPGASCRQSQQGASDPEPTLQAAPGVVEFAHEQHVSHALRSSLGV